MKSKATRAFSVMQGDTCHSTFPNLLLVFFFFRTVLIQDPGHCSPNNFIFPAMAFYIPCRTCNHIIKKASYRLWYHMQYHTRYHTRYHAFPLCSPVENILWFRATSMRTTAIPSHTGTEALLVSQMRRWRIQDPTLRLVAGFSRSTYGCGATEEHFHGTWLWQTLWPCGSNELRNPEHGGTLHRRRMQAQARAAGAQ